MRSGLTKITSMVTGALLLSGVLLPVTISAAAPTNHTVTETGCGANGNQSGTSTTSTIRGVVTTKTTYSGEITKTVIVPVGAPAARAKFMISDKAGNEYFATTRASANAAAWAFNRANPARYIGNGVAYYARTRPLAEEAAQNADSTGYVNGVPVSNTPQFLATSANGTAFFSNCSQARANTLARLDTNRPPKKVWHAKSKSTGQVMTSAVSAKFANALAAYHYVGSTPGELAAYGFNCQVLTANSLSGLITALQTQIASMPFVSYGGDFLGYDTTGTNPADMQMFRGATQAQANAAASAFGKSIVKGGEFVVNQNGLCASVNPSISQAMNIQNLVPGPLRFNITPTSIIAYAANVPSVTVNVATGMKMAYGGDINVGGQLVTFPIFVEASSTTGFYPTPTNGTFNMAWNMAYYDSGHVAAANPAQASQALTTPFTTTHATLPTTSITCTPGPSALPGATSVTLLSYNCPPNYQEATS